MPRVFTRGWNCVRCCEINILMAPMTNVGVWNMIFNTRTRWVNLEHFCFQWQESIGESWKLLEIKTLNLVPDRLGAQVMEGMAQEMWAQKRWPLSKEGFLLWRHLMEAWLGHGWQGCRLDGGGCWVLWALVSKLVSADDGRTRFPAQTAAVKSALTPEVIRSMLAPHCSGTILL